MTGKWKISVEDRFWCKVEKRGPDDCWEWKGAINSTGRGIFHFRDKDVHAHRVAWMLTNGEIPDGLLICHKCDNGKCVNPNHLFLGTHADNIHDMISKGRNRVLKGEEDPKHKLTEEQVRFIKANYKPYDLEFGQSGLALKFGVSRTAIEAIVHGLNWKHVS